MAEFLGMIAGGTLWIWVISFAIYSLISRKFQGNRIKQWGISICIALIFTAIIRLFTFYSIYNYLVSLFAYIIASVINYFFLRKGIKYAE